MQMMWVDTPSSYSDKTILLDELLFDDDGNMEEVFAHNLGEDRHQPVDDLD